MLKISPSLLLVNISGSDIIENNGNPSDLMPMSKLST